MNTKPTETYQFTFFGKTVKVQAVDVFDAYGQANKIVRQSLSTDVSFAWFDGVKPRTFYLNTDVFLD